MTPTARAGELADMVRAKVPGAQIAFAPDPELQPILDKVLLPIGDRHAREEWQWTPRYTQERVVDDFLDELNRHPERYA